MLSDYKDREKVRGEAASSLASWEGALTIPEIHLVTP